jgi:hypothetical protein
VSYLTANAASRFELFVILRDTSISFVAAIERASWKKSPEQTPGLCFGLKPINQAATHAEIP